MKFSSLFNVALVLPGLPSAAICNNNCGRQVAGTAIKDLSFDSRSSLCVAFVTPIVNNPPRRVAQRVKASLNWNLDTNRGDQTGSWAYIYTAINPFTGYPRKRPRSSPRTTQLPRSRPPNLLTRRHVLMLPPADLRVNALRVSRHPRSRSSRPPPPSLPRSPP